MLEIARIKSVKRERSTQQFITRSKLRLFRELPLAFAYQRSLSFCHLTERWEENHTRTVARNYKPPLSARRSRKQLEASVGDRSFLRLNNSTSKVLSIKEDYLRLYRSSGNFKGKHVPRSQDFGQQIAKYRSRFRLSFHGISLLLIHFTISAVI